MSEDSRDRLSVVLATFNEENNLEECLNSVKDLADEIIVVDVSSTDRTVEIAKKFGARTKITTNKPIFHINKQLAIDLSSKDWILQLDADERVSPELAKEIMKVLKSSVLSLESKVNGFWIPRKNWFLGRFLMKGGQYPDYTLRLYRKGKGRLPQKDVHEQALVEGSVGYLKEPLLHYPYKNFASYYLKWNRYNDLLVSQIKGNLKNKNSLVKIGYAAGYLLVKPAHWLFTTYG